MKPKGILAFDIDGTLTPRSQSLILPPKLPNLLNRLDDLGYFSVPVTGKPAPYAKRLLEENDLKNRGIIAENAGVYCEPESDNIEVYGEGVDKIEALKRKIKIDVNEQAVQEIELFGKKFELAIDPEDISIITFFTDPDRVNSRWQFNKSIEVEHLFELLNKLIVAEGWQKNLEVLKPFPDKALQIIRKDTITGKSVDKSCLPEVISRIYEIEETPPIIMFGDGHNDIPAMQPKEVFPVTFANAEEKVKEFVCAKKGFVSGYPAPDGLGVIDCLYWLANQNNIFSKDNQEVKNYILEYFPELKK